MTINTADRWRIAASLSLATLAIAGCAMFPHDRRAELDGPEMTDEQTRAQVVEPAQQIVKLAALQGVTGSFHFDSCNDQGEPPFRGECRNLTDQRKVDGVVPVPITDELTG